MLSLGKLLELTLADREPAQKTQMTPGGTRVRWLACGALEVTPAPQHDSGLDVLLSAGVHGNDVAPIEALDELIHAIARGTLLPRARLLFLFGNPAAIRAGVRYRQQSLNSLFNGRHELSSGEEAMRACELERLAASFFSASAERVGLHYDLYSSGRGSLLEPFALCAAPAGLAEPERQHLAYLGMAAVLVQGQPGCSFTGYTGERLGAMAYSLEFSREASVQRLLRDVARVIETGEVAIDEAGAGALKAFRASQDITPRTEDFRLRLAEGLANFTELARGTLLAVDGSHTRWLVEQDHARIVFAQAAGGAGWVVVPA